MSFLPRLSARALGVVFALCLAVTTFPHAPVARAQPAEAGRPNVHVVNPAPGHTVESRKVRAISTAVVNFDALARQEALHPQRPTRVPGTEALSHHIHPLEPIAEGAPSPEFTPLNAPTMAQVASPSPTVSYMGLDDIPMVDSVYVVIPPDCGGAVGLTKVMQGLNNNYRIQDKATGAVVSTVGTATFWAPTGETDLLGLYRPRTLYDPYNNRWIAVMEAYNTNNILLGVSQTSDPSGSWFLYRFASGASIDFPIVGFNKNWISISINTYDVSGLFSRGINLVVDYPQARAGVGTGTLFQLANGGNFCSAPAVTYSATEDTLFVLTHLSSTAATYMLETITGTPSAPSYNLATSTQTRPGGGWTDPSGNILPQSAPNSGTSICGATPCKIEVQDSQINSAPVYRGGLLYYTQTIGLGSHTAVQWTEVPTGAGFVLGGRIDDPTATATNGGKWYAYPHIAVNVAGDMMIGYSQFSSAQHPSAGYSMHLAGDLPGSLRTPFIYKAGEDYYHKTFGTGRNAWGSYSQVDVDPDDQMLWAIQEYAEARDGTDDNIYVANSSRWSTYWAAVAGGPTVTLDPGYSGPEGNSGLTVFGFTVRLSAPSAAPVTVTYATSDGTATVADNDYQPATGSMTIPPGNPPLGFIFVNVVGDTTREANETFSLTLTGATGGILGSPVVETNTILNDDYYIITASAGAGGSISPSGSVMVQPGSSQTFTVLPNACFHITDVLVDGVSQGAITTYTFNAVSAAHTIAASFAPDRTLSIGSVIAPEGNTGTSDFAFPVTVSGAPCGQTVRVTWKTVDGTALRSDSDYAPDSTVLSLIGSATSGVITVHVNGDLTPEDPETFFVDLMNPVNAGIAKAEGQGTILNDDGVSAAEGTAPKSVSFAIQGNPSSTIAFRIGLPATTRADLSVYDVSGRRVAALLQGTAVGMGYHTVRWNPRATKALPGSGVYFVRFRADGQTFVKRFVLLR